MLKQILIAIILTVLAVLCLPQISAFLHFLGNLYHIILNFISNYIHGNYVANVIASTVAMLILPMLIAGIPAIIYYFVAKRTFPYFPHFFWVVWVLLLAVLI